MILSMEKERRYSPMEISIRASIMRGKKLMVSMWRLPLVKPKILRFK
jgi:hypothetical protein